MGDPNTEFVEDIEGTQSRLGRIRLLLYFSIAALQLTVLIIYSLEGIHNTSGRYIWVIVFFASQLIASFITIPLWILVLSIFAFKIKDNKQFLSKYFYPYMILMEDYKHV